MSRRICLLALLLLLLSLLSSTGMSAPNEYAIFIDVEQKTLYLFGDDTLLAHYPVATGAWDTPTPLGVFRITHRFSGQMGAFGTCFLGLNVPWGNYGIHGTDKPDSIGQNASHGCIRMRVKDAEALYAMVPNGTTVVIACGPYGDIGTSLRTLKNGDRSSMVRAMQCRLRALGYFSSTPDGIWGNATQGAVDAARTAYHLSPNGLCDWALYQAIGLTLFE